MIDLGGKSTSHQHKLGNQTKKPDGLLAARLGILLSSFTFHYFSDPGGYAAWQALSCDLTQCF
jgi:hypothetical protein